MPWSTIASLVNRAGARMRAASPNRLLNSALERSSTMASVSAATSPGGTSRPVCRSSMTSGMPPRRLAMAGQPAIAASVSDSGNPSRCVEGRTTRSSADRTAGGSPPSPPKPTPPPPPPPPPPAPAPPAGGAADRVGAADDFVRAGFQEALFERGPAPKFRHRVPVVDPARSRRQRRQTSEDPRRKGVRMNDRRPRCPEGPGHGRDGQRAQIDVVPEDTRRNPCLRQGFQHWAAAGQSPRLHLDLSGAQAQHERGRHSLETADPPVLREMNDFHDAAPAGRALASKSRRTTASISRARWS